MNKRSIISGLMGATVLVAGIGAGPVLAADITINMAVSVDKAWCQYLAFAIDDLLIRKSLKCSCCDDY